MSYFIKLAGKLFVITCLIVQAFHVQAQSQAEMDAALTALQSMSPEQIEAMLKMAMNTMPADKRADLEDALKLMKATRPETQTLKWKNKTIVFVPIAHASTPEFYKGVASVVTDYKSKGYTVFFEQLKREARAEASDAITQDTISLKLRKLIGLDPNRQTYSVLKKFFPDIIAQPEYSALGVTTSDLNADISVEQLVHQYESLYGPVVLSQCDFDTKDAGVFYNCGKLGNDIEPVVLDYRNENVAGLVKSADTDKILIIYGVKHVPGIIKLLSEGG